MIRSLRRGVLAAALLLLAASHAASAAPVSVGHSGWQWGNPQPQGNTLRGLAFAGARGFAVGDFGTLLTTEDAGATWSGLSTGTFANLDLVESIDADSVVIGGGCTVRRSDDGGQTFRRLPFTSSERRCSTTILAFSFSSADSGFLLLADGTVLRTTDGGASFQKRVSVPGTPATGSGAETATDIDFVSPTVGVATTSAGPDGHVYRTTDGGGSWVLVASSEGADATAGGGPLQAVRFVTPDVGYAVG